jgi:hypothetical protein
LQQTLDTLLDSQGSSENVCDVHQGCSVVVGENTMGELRAKAVQKKARQAKAR